MEKILMMQFSIEDYEAKGIRIYFRPEHLITLYSYSVSVPYAFLSACLFRQECIIVELAVFDSFYDLIERLGITPITDMFLNEEYTNLIRQRNSLDQK